MLQVDVGLNRQKMYTRSDVPVPERGPDDYVKMTYAFGVNVRGYTQEGRLNSPVCVRPNLVTGLPHDAYRKAIVSIEEAKADQIRYRAPTWALRFVGNSAITSATVVGIGAAIGPINAPTLICAILTSMYLGVYFLRADYKADTRVFSEARCFALALNDMVTLANTGEKSSWMHSAFSVQVRRNINPEVFDAAVKEIEELGYTLAGHNLSPEVWPIAPEPQRPSHPRSVSPERMAA